MYTQHNASWHLSQLWYVHNVHNMLALLGRCAQRKRKGGGGWCRRPGARQTCLVWVRQPPFLTQPVVPQGLHGAGHCSTTPQVSIIYSDNLTKTNRIIRLLDITGKGEISFAKHALLR